MAVFRLTLTQFNLHFILFLKLEKDEELIRPRLKLNYVDRNRH